MFQVNNFRTVSENIGCTEAFRFNFFKPMVTDVDSKEKIATNYLIHEK
jgi:hypothetical protein